MGRGGETRSAGSDEQCEGERALRICKREAPVHALKRASRPHAGQQPTQAQRAAEGAPQACRLLPNLGALEWGSRDDVPK